MSKLNDFLSVCLVMLCGGDVMTANEKYARTYGITPRIFCKDGFNISIQNRYMNYCGSENGVRSFGLDWKTVEWGFPSEELPDEEKYNSEGDVGGYVPMEVMDELLESHGGIDYEETFKQAYATYKKHYDNVLK